MKHKIDLTSWERLQNWQFMKDFYNSWYSIASEVDCTRAWNESKTNHTSFFIKYLYALLRAANEVKEFGYRQDTDGGVCWFDSIGATVPVAVPGKTFYTVLIPYEKDYKTFYQQAKKIMNDIPEDGDPYGVNRKIIESGETGVINISAIPRLYFSSITYTFYRPNQGSHWPLLNVGKAVEREGRMHLPISIYVDHCFVDGNNLATFMELTQTYLDE